eukprot:771383-Pleurochrysis_carterae.AAC.8
MAAGLYFCLQVLHLMSQADEMAIAHTRRERSIVALRCVVTNVRHGCCCRSWNRTYDSFA